MKDLKKNDLEKGMILKIQDDKGEGYNFFIINNNMKIAKINGDSEYEPLTFGHFRRIKKIYKVEKGE